VWAGSCSALLTAWSSALCWLSVACCRQAWLNTNRRGRPNRNYSGMAGRAGCCRAPAGPRPVKAGGPRRITHRHAQAGVDRQQGVPRRRDVGREGVDEARAPGEQALGLDRIGMGLPVLLQPPPDAARGGLGEREGRQVGEVVGRDAAAPDGDAAWGAEDVDLRGSGGRWAAAWKEWRAVLQRRPLRTNSGSLAVAVGAPADCIPRRSTRLVLDTRAATDSRPRINTGSYNNVRQSVFTLGLHGAAPGQLARRRQQGVKAGERAMLSSSVHCCAANQPCTLTVFGEVALDRLVRMREGRTLSLGCFCSRYARGRQCVTGCG
jgi:hypothetical protein